MSFDGSDSPTPRSQRETAAAGPAPVRIAGSGPAGLACAIALRQRGLPVEVYERRPEAGSRFEGGYQILAAYGESPRPPALVRELGVDIESLDGRWLRGARFLDGRGGAKEFEARRPFAYLLRRGAEPGALDHALVERGRELGVRFFEGQRLTVDEMDVDATGPHRVDGMAMEVVFESDARERADVLLAPQLFSGGYAYLLVNEHHATLGVAVLRDFRNLEDYVEQALDHFERVEGFARRELRRSKHHMCYGRADRAGDGRVLRVGEAAGLQDYLFGLGLRNALLSGCLAARSIAEGLSYDAMCRRSFHPRMAASEVDRWLYERGWLGWFLARSPAHQLDRSLQWLHNGSRWRAPFARWLGDPKRRGAHDD